VFVAARAELMGTISACLDTASAIDELQQQGPIVDRVRCGLAQRTCSGSRATGEKAQATRWTWLACPCLMQEEDSEKRWCTDRDLKEVQRQSVRSIAQLAGVPVLRAVNH
jgi:hypothetical protein